MTAIIDDPGRYPFLVVFVRPVCGCMTDDECHTVRARRVTWYFVPTDPERREFDLMTEAEVRQALTAHGMTWEAVNGREYD